MPQKAHAQNSIPVIAVFEEEIWTVLTLHGEEFVNTFTDYQSAYDWCAENNYQIYESYGIND